MKNIILVTVALVAMGVSAASEEGTTSVTFKSRKYDYYSDGQTVVKDNEQYAVIWIRNGCTFKGFNYDGTLVDSASGENKIVFMNEDFRAKDGKMELTVAYMAPNAELAQGTYHLCLLDSRIFAQSGEVGTGGSVKASTVVSTTPSDGGISAKVEQADRVVVPALLPLDVSVCRITHVDVQTDEVVVTVEDTDSRVDYNLAADDAASVPSTAAAAAAPVTGTAGALRLRYPRKQGESSKFFKVINNPL